MIELMLRQQEIGELVLMRNGGCKGASTRGSEILREWIMYRDPVILGSGQILFVLGVVGQQLSQQHGLHCADGVAQGAQELEFEIIEEGLHTFVQRLVRLRV